MNITMIVSGVDLAYVANSITNMAFDTDAEPLFEMRIEHLTDPMAAIANMYMTRWPWIVDVPSDWIYAQ